MKGFYCSNCKKEVSLYSPGTYQRNHCPFCGYSLHVDVDKGDRLSQCRGLMEPVGIKSKGKDEVCLVHICKKCRKVNYNRIAGDDSTKMIIDVFNKSLSLDSETKNLLRKNNINLLNSSQEGFLREALFGKLI